MMNIKYNLIRSSRKTLALLITRDGNLEVRAPHKLPMDVIEEFIQRKQSWIEKKQSHILSTKTEPKAFTAGEKFLYLGQEYELSTSDQIRTPVELEGKLFIKPKHLHRAKKVITDWYKQEAIAVFTDRAAHFSALMNCNPDSVKLSTATHRWGSCSVKGNVNFNWRLIMAPLDIIDYVIVHELAHLKQHNHSSQFWQIVEKIIPDYKARRKWLKTNGIKLTI